MPNVHPYAFQRMPTAPPPSGNNPNQIIPVFNGKQFIRPGQPTLQPPFPQTNILFRAISPHQQTPPRTFAFTDANAPAPLQGWPQQQPPHSYQDYTLYLSDEVSTSGQSPVSQVRTNTNLSPSLSQSTTDSTTKSWIPTHTTIPTAPYQFYPYEAAQPEPGAVIAKRKNPEQIDPGKSILNPNPAEYVPGENWSPPNKKTLETKDITKGPSKVADASTPLKNSKAESKEASTPANNSPPPPTPSILKDPLEHHERLNSPLKKIHESNNPDPDSRDVDKTPENSTGSPIEADKFDSKANMLLAATNNDEHSGVVADDTRKTVANSPIPSKPGATKKTVEHGTDREVKGTGASAVAKKPALPGATVEPTVRHEFVSDGSCRPKEYTRKKPVEHLPISAQEVLNLQLKKKKPQKHPEVLDLLYLRTFDFKKKHGLFSGIDASVLAKKGSNQKKKQLLQNLRTQLEEVNYQGTVPNYKMMERMFSPEKLLFPPTTTINIHQFALRLRNTAYMINAPMYQQRELLIKSLSAHYVNHSVSILDCAKTREIKTQLQSIGSDNISNIRNILMLFFPYFKPQLIELKAPFLNPTLTLYCSPELATHQLEKELHKHIKVDTINKISNHNIHHTTTLDGIISLTDSLDVKIKNLDNDADLLTDIRRDSPTTNEPAPQPTGATKTLTGVTDDQKPLKKGKQPNPPEKFSRQCIKTHLIFVCDLMHKMLKISDKDNIYEIEAALIGPLDSLLNIIQTMHKQLPKFQDEYIMTAQTCCFFLQNTTMQKLISLQKHQLLTPEYFTKSEIKITTKLPAKLENTLLNILENSLQCRRSLDDDPELLPNIQKDSSTADNLASGLSGDTTPSTGVNNEQLLNISMCLLKTIADNNMFLPANQNDDQERLARLAEFCTTMLKNLSEILAQEEHESNTYPEKVLHVCIPVFKGISKIIREGIPNSMSLGQLENAISKLTDQCNNRRGEIIQKQKDYEAELNKQYINRMLAKSKEYEEKALQDSINKVKKEALLKKKAIINNEHPTENIDQGKAHRQELIEQHNALITETEERLATFKEQLRKSTDYKTELEKFDDVFKSIADQPELQVWIYGEVAYDLFKAYSKDFCRAKAFAQELESMHTFCISILQELRDTKVKRDRHWLYTRDKNQPIKKRNFLYLVKISDPEKMQTLVVRALKSVQIYQKALNKAKAVIHKPLQETTILTGKEIIKHSIYTKERQLLIDRINLINDEIKELQDHLRELQNIPSLSDVLSKVREIFKWLPSTQSNTNNKESDEKEFEMIVEKLKKEWAPDTSITESQEYANIQLKLIMQEFTSIQEQLTKDRLNSSTPIPPPVISTN